MDKTSDDLLTISYRFSHQHGVILECLSPNYAEIIYHDKTEPESIVALRRYLKRSLKLTYVNYETFQHIVTQRYHTDDETSQEMLTSVEEDLDLSQLANELPKTQDLLESQDDAPIIRLLNALLSRAIKQKASDIHIETFAQKVSVRLRVDGTLHETLAVPRMLSPLLISRIKVMAKLDIAEKRLPQDGRITLKIAGHTIDVRVSTLPSSHGERIVLRLLDKKTAKLDLASLGMYDDTLATMRQLIAVPHGIILVTGPTGSGKTTSLYAMLSELNDITRNILTVEDPIEYDLPGIGQTQVNTKIDMSFAKGLRSILRQDPDVVMIGEIRDSETADIAVQASLTGHLVLSTLHTNTAIGAIARLRDMGVEPFLLASSLVSLIAQRLVRLLCLDCKQAYRATPAELEFLGLPKEESITLYKARGCEVCKQIGYRGRKGIYELIPVDDTLRQSIHDDQGEQLMAQYVRKSVKSIREDGFRRVCHGETSIEEILRVTAEG